MVRLHVEHTTVEKLCPFTAAVHTADTDEGAVFQNQHVGPMEGYFTGQKSIVHLISKSADMLCVLYYL